MIERPSYKNQTFFTSFLSALSTQIKSKNKLKIQSKIYIYYGILINIGHNPFLIFILKTVDERHERF